MYIIENINRHAEQKPQAVAIESLDQSISYCELADQVSELADYLKTAGYQRVGLLDDNSISWAVIDLACMQADICCIPVPHFFSRTQIEHLCIATGMQALIGNPQRISACDIDKQANTYDGIPDIAIHNLRGTEMVRGDTSAIPAQLDNVAKITFTSGTTGTPKGVCLSRSSIENAVRALDQRVPAGISKRHLSVLPLVTLLENVAGLYLSLVQGAQIMLYPMKQIGFNNLASVDEKQFVLTLNKSDAESLILVPELLRLLVYAVANRLVNADRFKFIAVGGGVVSEQLLNQAGALGLPVLQGYGLSECASVVALNSLHANRQGSVGQPLQHMNVKIADDGEILVAGNLMHGYLGESSIAGGWLSTGDIGHMDEQGYLYVTGRKKNLLVTAFGKNVSPEWLEGIFLQNQLIKQVLVTGEASTHLCAVIVPVDGVREVQIDRLVTDINNQLPDYAKIKEYRLAKESFNYENGQLTANGRLKRAAIAARYI